MNDKKTLTNFDIMAVGVRNLVLPSVLIAMAVLLNAVTFGQTKVTPKSKSTIVPLEVIRGHVYVSTFVNGRGPFRFAVDIGANGIGWVDVSLIKELNLTPLVNNGKDDIKTATMPSVTLDSLSIGSTTRSKVVVGSANFNAPQRIEVGPLMGFIGRDFFSGHLLTINYAKRELIISSDSLKEFSPNVVRYETAFGVPFRLGQHEAIGWLDTGAGLGIVLNLDWAKTLGIRAQREVGRFRKENKVNKLLAPEEPLALEVEIAGNRLSYGNVVFAEFGDRIDIGGAFFAANGCSISIDQKKQLLKLGCSTQ